MVWVVTDFLEPDGKPTQRILDYLEPMAEGWAEVRTEPDEFGEVRIFTFVEIVRNWPDRPMICYIDGPLYYCQQRHRPYTLVETREIELNDPTLYTQSNQ